jgi:superfamily I DNA/RNA helicase
MHGLAFLKRVFFGTIHSFAFSLIKTYGYALNISDALKILENKDALWQDFCRECVIEWPVSIESEWNELEPFLDLKAIWSLAQSSFNNECIAALPPRPSLNLDFIYAFKSPSKRLQSGVEKSIAILKDWALNWENTQKAWPFPDITAGGDDFIETVHAALKPLKDWVALSWLLMANTIKKAYMAYRLNAGYIEYGDMIAIAHQLIQLTPIKNNIEKQSSALILDEAQDVDVDQFKFMLDLVGLNGQTAVNDGRFVMVGDPQQAIYSQRTPVEVYLNTHQRLIHEGWVEPLIFSVTFRCGKNIIHYLNERGVETIRIPIEDMNIPSKETMLEVLGVINKVTEENKIVYVHCG